MLPKYYYEKKRKNKLKMQVFAACVFILGSVVVALFYMRTPIANVQEVARTATAPPEVLQAGASVEITKLYTCGHTKKEIIPADFKETDKTEAEIARDMPQWEILNFEPRYLTVEEKMSAECDEHYLIKLVGSKIQVSRMNSQNDIIREVKINISTFSESDENIMKSGIIANSEYELLEIMESFSS